MARGAHKRLVTFVMGCWGLGVVPERGPGLERKSDPSPFGDLPWIRLVPMRST